MIMGPVPARFVAQAPEAAWIYNYETGQITANSNACDAAERSYSLY